MLNLNVPCISESCIEIKIKLNFNFHFSLWCLKRFYETFWGTTKKCENKNSIIIFSLCPGLGQEELSFKNMDQYPLGFQ